MNILGKEDPYLKIGETNDRATAGGSDYVWALRDIDFKVEQGDVVGIIGKNGAGKSTLLKLLSKVTGPTVGTIRARGRIGALLEVGTGFHPEMTGRENIYMNGAIMGMTKNDVTRKLDEIIAFSGCERYIDTPVKRYSSGMTVRLGFAVAAHLEPEILVVDEVLAVGDAEFQKKAIGKMQDVSRGEGRTVLFVSHNMASIRLLCRNGIVLKKGRVDYIGDVNDAVDCYLKDNSFVSEPIIKSFKVNSSELKVESILINGKSGNSIKLKKGETDIVVEIKGEVFSDLRIEVEMPIYDANQVLVAYYCPCHVLGRSSSYKRGPFEIKETVHLPERMTGGEFYMSILLTEPNICYLGESLSPCKIETEGFVGAAGTSLLYKDRGLLVL